MSMMRIIESVKKMQETALGIRASGRRIGLVPTMGFLHEGHLSLLRIAKQEADVVVVSIFVNPIQFGPQEDFERYPRDFERDKKLCKGEKVDVIFCPSVKEMYMPGHSVYVEEKDMSKGLCGTSRPGHFRGVTTVVCKLFNIVKPHVVVFGQKDAQQARIIRQMVRDLNFPIKIIVAPTIREPNGLAMSSRNKYLAKRQRREATCLVEALRLAERLFENGERHAVVIRKEMAGVIRRAPSAEIEYIEIVDYETLRPVEKVAGVTLIALAVKIGRTRLIDNIVLAGSGA